MCAEKLLDSAEVKAWRHVSALFPSWKNDKRQPVWVYTVKWLLFLLPFWLPQILDTPIASCQQWLPRPLLAPLASSVCLLGLQVLLFFPQAKLCLLLLLLLTQTHKFFCQEHYHHVWLANPFSSNHSKKISKRITLLGNFVCQALSSS